MSASIIMVFIATLMGTPLSSSHALAGSLLGAGIGAAGHSAVVLSTTAIIVQVIGFACLLAVIRTFVLAIICAAIEADFRFGILNGSVCVAGIIITVLMVAGVFQIHDLLVIVLFILISPLLGMPSAFLFNILVSQFIKHSR